MPPQVIHVKNASKVAAALGSEKCQKIIDYLSKHHDATETKLSKELKIPLSTVHYNMKILVDAKLVSDKEYTYSAKGKEVTHYSLSKNPIVIIQEDNQLDILKAIVPAAIITAGVGVAYTLFHKTPVLAQESFRSMAAPMADGAADSALAAGEAAPTLMAKGADMTAQSAGIVPQDMLPFFLAGIVTMVFVTFLLAMVFRWWNTRIPK